jgi:hypothetical protein
MIAAAHMSPFQKNNSLLSASNDTREGRFMVRMGFLAWAILMDTMVGLFSLFLAPVPVVGWIIPYIFSMCMNATSGAALALALTREFGFFPKRLIGGFVTESIPLVNNLPFWSGVTLSLILRKAVNDNLPQAKSPLSPKEGGIAARIQSRIGGVRRNPQAEQEETEEPINEKSSMPKRNSPLPAEIRTKAA